MCKKKNSKFELKMSNWTTLLKVKMLLKYDYLESPNKMSYQT